MNTQSHRLLLLAIPLITLLFACSGGSGDTDSVSPGTTFPEEPFDPRYPSTADDYEGQGDNTPASSTLITVGEIQSRSLWPIGDVDYVKVELTAGTTYEFSVNQLCVPCDTYMSLYDTDGATQLTTNDDYLGLDSRINYTAPVDGIYFLKIESFKEVFRVTDPTTTQPAANNGTKGDDYGVSAYTLSVHTFTDADGDGSSSYYDCNDNDPTVFPWSDEIAGDGISQACSGVDQLDPATADSFEPDNDPSTAKPMYMTNIGLWEIQFQQSAWMQNARTIDLPGETDYFTFTLAPRQGVYLNMHKGSYPATLLLTLYDSHGVPLTDPLDPATSTGTDWPTQWVANTGNSDKTFYASYAAADGVSTAWYVPALYNAGVDYDGDGYYTRDWGSVRDCNDRDASIHPGAVEQVGNGVDSNCNGDDNT